MAGSRSRKGGEGARRDRLIRERHHDAYKSREKLPEPAACPECGAVFREGRWSWQGNRDQATPSLCPACRRIRDDYPAGTVTIGGDFAREHRDEIVSLVRNVEERERSLHPLKRIIDCREIGDELVVRTTEAHLARALGVALHRAYRGELEYRYGSEDDLLRVRWFR